MDNLQQMAATAAVKKMLAEGYISICTVDKILKATGGVPNSYDYEILHMLHCVNFRDMDPELIRGLPLILQRVLGAESLQFEFQAPTRRLMLVE